MWPLDKLCAKAIALGGRKCLPAVEKGGGVKG